MVIDFPVKEKDEAYFSENTEGTLEHYFLSSTSKDDGAQKIDSGCSNHITGH